MTKARLCKQSAMNMKIYNVAHVHHLHTLRLVVLKQRRGRSQGSSLGYMRLQYSGTGCLCRRKIYLC